MGAGFQRTLALIASVIPGAAAAQTVTTALSQISVNAEYLSQNYHETDDAQNGAFDREIGTIPGVSVDAGYIASPYAALPNLFLGGEFEYNYGNITYHGTTLSGTARINGETKTRIENGYFEVGQAYYVLSPNLMMIPTIFWGQRDWNRDLEGDYEVEDYRTMRLGAALHIAYSFTSRLTAIERVGIAEMLAPDMQLNLDGSTYKFRQGAQPVAEAESGFDYRIGANWHVRASADITGFTFGASNEVSYSTDEGLLEPSSSTTDVSVKIGVGYSFP